MAWPSISFANPSSLARLPLASLPSAPPKSSHSTISLPSFHPSSSIRSISRLLDRSSSLVILENPFNSKTSGTITIWELASVLRDVKSRFDSAGVKLIAVGVGTPDKARILAERLPFPSDCLYADPDRKVYNALGLYYGLARTFLNPASAKVFTRLESMQKALNNYTISATPDDRSSVLQQGGMFIFKGKQLIYARRDEGTGDHAPLEDILGLCCSTPVV